MHAGRAQRCGSPRRLRSSSKNSRTCAATTGPTSRTCWISSSAGRLQRLEAPKCSASASAVASPTSRMPSANRKRGSVVCLLRSSASTRFAADFSPMRSSPASSSAVSAYRSAGVVDPARLDELLDQLVAQPLDVHRAARGEMPQRLCRCAGRRARRSSARRPRPRRASTCEPQTGQRAGSSTRRASARAPLRHHAHDLGNHVARAAHDHGVADPHVLARELVHVVQRRVADRDAADEHRLQARDRRQRAGAADLELARPATVVVSSCAGNLCATRPARRARDEAEVALPVEAVHLVDDAVDLVAERVAPRADARVVLEAARRRPSHHVDLRAGAQAPARAAPPAPRCAGAAVAQPSTAPTP